MRVIDHRDAEGDGIFGWGFRQYREGTALPRLVIDTSRGIEKPSDGSARMNGAFDIHFDSTVYVGLSAPFVVADLGATVVRAFESLADVSTDHLLQPGGGRTAAPAEATVLGDSDIWSLTDG